MLKRMSVWSSRKVDEAVTALHARIIGRLEAAPKSSVTALKCSETAETDVDCTSVEVVLMEEKSTAILAPASVSASTSGPSNDSVDPPLMEIVKFADDPS